MKLFSLALLSAAALLTTAAPSTELSFSPEEGSSLTTTHERLLELELKDSTMRLFLDGEEQEDTESPEIELTMRETESIAFTDEFVELGDGRVLRLSRSFDKIGTNSHQLLTDPMGEEYESDSPGSSELESTTVAFVWNAEDEEYTASFPEDEDLDADLLDDLVATADFSWFLPDEEIEEGDTWAIDKEAFIRMSSPSGDLKTVREGEEEEEDDFGEQFDEHLEGDLEGEFRGFREVDGSELVVIHVTASLETYVEQEQEIETEEGEGTSSETFRFSFELEGDLLWDARANHARSLELNGEVEMTMETSEQFSGGGHELAFTSTQEFLGTIKYEIQVD